MNIRNFTPSVSITWFSMVGGPPLGTPWSSVPDGIHYIQGIGTCEKKERLCYTRTEVLRISGDARVVVHDVGNSGFAFSTLTDAERLKNKQDEERAQKEEQERREQEQRNHDALVESARAKLTEAEYNAVLGEGRGY